VNPDTMFGTLSQCANDLQPGLAFMAESFALIEFDSKVPAVAKRDPVSFTITFRSR